MSSKRFNSLDGLRGICALIVAVFHCDLALKTGHLLNHGYLCVDAFFILSGFVISSAYQTRLGDGMPAKSFAHARAQRLIPTHWLGTAAVAAVTLGTYFSGSLHLPEFTVSTILIATVLGFILLPDIAAPIDAAFPINTVLWSLCDEWVINLLYAKWLFRISVPALAVLGCGAWAIVCVYAYHNPYALCIGMRNSDLFPGFLRAGAGFIAGIVLFRLYAAGALAKLPSIRPELIYSLFFLVAAVPTTRISPTFDVIAVSLMPLLIALLVKTDRPTAGIFLWLGAISYPLYVCQLAPVMLATAYLTKSPSHNLLFAIPILAGAIALAWGISWINSLGFWSRRSSGRPIVTGASPG